MKTVAKVFIILGMVCFFWLNLPLIFGTLALIKMKTEKPSFALCICVLLFCNIIGGICLLLSQDKEYGTQTVSQQQECFI